MTPLLAIREMSVQSILQRDTSIWTCNKYTLNSHNLQLLSRNGRENAGNFPSLDFPCDMNNNGRPSWPRAPCEQRHANEHKNNRKSNRSNKITFSSDTFENKVKKI
jgi:hypothetical protein